MVIGDPATFAIECYHEPLPNPGRRVFGRMCLWTNGRKLGHIDEGSCMLNVTQRHLEDLLIHLDSLNDPVLKGLDDRGAFDYLDRLLYTDNERSIEEVVRDAKQFRKFDFLTNGGESFDHTKSFVLLEGSNVRILFDDQKDGFIAAHVERSAFVSVIEHFLEWLADEGRSAAKPLN